MEGTRAEIAGALIRKGDAVEIIEAECNSEYHQSSQRITELKKEVEEVKEALLEIGWH